MARDIFAAVPTTARLWGAVLLTLAVPTADKFVAGVGTSLPGTTIYGDCGYSDGPYCTPDTYLPGEYFPGTNDYLSHAQLRVLIWAAILALVAVAALRRTLRTRRVARLATLLLGAALVFALSERTPPAVVALVLALLLVAPPAWRRVRPDSPAFAPVFGSGRRGR